RKFSDVTELTYALRVDYVLEGGVRRDGDSVSVNARLIRIGDRTQIWASSYDSDEGGSPAAADELAAAIASSLDPVLATAERRLP
ncbi:MAG TPA: FlgO family outer membrane protein, partial [Vicinamibacterales bacterium]|nr:FlgO family outer membrane protein [Vicinamibacterales bacterium]